MTSRFYNRMIFILSLAGAVDALVLTLNHAQVVNAPCGPLHGCAYVDMDAAAAGLGIPGLQSIPTAVFGLVMYLFLMAVSFLRIATTDEKPDSKLPAIQLGVSLLGVIISGWLTYREAYVIHHWCRYCVVSAIIILLICFTAILEQLHRKDTPVMPASLPEGEPS